MCTSSCSLKMTECIRINESQDILRSTNQHFHNFLTFHHPNNRSLHLWKMTRSVDLDVMCSSAHPSAAQTSTQVPVPARRHPQNRQQANTNKCTEWRRAQQLKVINQTTGPMTLTSWFCSSCLHIRFGESLRNDCALLHIETQKIQTLCGWWQTLEWTVRKYSYIYFGVSLVKFFFDGGGQSKKNAHACKCL